MIHDSVVCDIRELKAAYYNPRTIKPEAKESLRAALKKFGLVQPIVANKRTLHIIGGHQRVEVMIEEGITEAPVIWLDLAEDEEKALNLQLNAIRGEWDWAKLAPMVKELKGKKWNVDQLGFDFATSQALIDVKTDSEAFKPGLTPEERKAIYEANTIKQIVVYFETSQYVEVLEKLKLILEDQKLETHSDVFLFLVNQYAANRSIPA